MFIRSDFENERSEIIEQISNDINLKKLALEFVNDSNKQKYAYVWNWLGLPIIQMPEDIVKVQEIIYEAKPDVVIETGVAWGGSLLLSASILNIQNPHGKVIGIDITIPQHNSDSILSSPFASMITLIEGSSIDIDTFNRVSSMVGVDSKVLLILDSHHTAEHVLKELHLWSNLVKKGNFIIVCDTIVEHIEAPIDRPRPWSKGNNPMTAVEEFLKINKRFSSSNSYNSKTLASFHPNGVLEAIN